MIRLLLLSLILCIAPNGFSQYSTFSDYGKCYKGLKDSKRNIIWPADFESLDKIYKWEAQNVTMPYERHRNMRVWIGQKNGSFGILEFSGEVIIPFEYDFVEPTRNDCYIAGKNGKCLLLNNKAEVLFNFDYSTITTLESGYDVEKNGRHGIMNNAFKEILPPEYDGISSLGIRGWSEGVKPIVSTTKYYITQGKKRGVFDIIHGVVVEPSENKIRPRWVTNCPESSAAYSIYTKHKPNSRVMPDEGVINAKGDWIIPMGKNRTSVCVQPLDSCGLKYVMLAYETDEQLKRTRVYNLETKNRSQWFDLMDNQQLNSIYKNGNKWGILDDNFEVLFKSKKYIPGTSDHNPMRHHYIESRPVPMTGDAFFHNNFIWKDNLIYIHKMYSIEEQGEIGRLSRKGLMNYSTGKSIPPNYDYIHLHHQDGKPYYWAIKDVYTDRKDYEIVHVYNANMHKVKSFKVTNDSGQVPNFRRDKNEDVLMRIFRGGRIGARNMAGKMVIPMKYVKMEHHDFYYYYNAYSKNRGFYEFEDKKGNKGAIDTQGKTIIPFQYDNFRIGVGRSIYAYNNDTISIYDKNFNLLISPIGFNGSFGKLDTFGQYLFDGEERKERLNMVFIFVKENELWFNHGEGFKLLDGSRFEFEGTYLSLYGFIDIDHDGHVVKLRYGDRIDTKGKGSVVVNPGEVKVVEPEVKPEEKKPIPPKRYGPPLKKPRFVWKVTSSKQAAKKVWHLYDSSGTSASEYDFEFPVYEDYNTRIFKSNGSFGLFDDSLNIVLPPDYDYIYNSRGDYLLQRDELWGIYTKSGKFLEPQFSEISLKWYAEGRFVFSGDKIGVLKPDLTYLVELMDSAALVNSTDLATVMKLTHNSGNKAIAHKGYIFNQEPRSFYARINSANMVYMEQMASTSNKTMNSGMQPQTKLFPIRKENKVSFEMRREETRAYIEIGCHSKHYYSYEHWSRPWSHHSNYSFKYDGLNSRDRAYYIYHSHYNYRIVNGKTIPIGFNDIFKTDAASTQKLKDLIIGKLNKLQPFGNNCENIDAHIETLKANFYLGSYEMKFMWPERNGFILRFYKSEIRDVMKVDVWD